MVISWGVCARTTAEKQVECSVGRLDEDVNRVTSTARVPYCTLSRTLQVNHIEGFGDKYSIRFSCHPYCFCQSNWKKLPPTWVVYRERDGIIKELQSTLL